MKNNNTNQPHPFIRWLIGNQQQSDKTIPSEAEVLQMLKSVRLQLELAADKLESSGKKTDLSLCRMQSAGEKADLSLSRLKEPEFFNRNLNNNDNQHNNTK